MYRALIVEDEPPILRKITSSLRAVSDAFDIEVAHDGQEAFEYLMNHPVDVVFTDIRMPIMDGLALSDKIRKLYPEICILIITGYYDYSYAKSAIQTGVFDYILKPLSSVEFRATIQRVEQHLDKQRSQRILQSLTNIASGQPNDDAEVFQNAGYQYLSAFLIVRNGYPYRFDESSTCELGRTRKACCWRKYVGMNTCPQVKPSLLRETGTTNVKLLFWCCTQPRCAQGTGIWRDFSSDFRLLAMGPLIT